MSPDFEEWYAREYGSVVRVLAAIAGEADVAGDVVAEAFSRAFERWDKVGALANPTGWVYRVAVNLLRGRWRRSAIERRLLIRRAVPPSIGRDGARSGALGGPGGTPAAAT